MPHTRETHPNGHWVAAEIVHPAANTAGREARFESGLTTTYWQEVPSIEGPVTHWWFETVDDAMEGRE